jgi:hypothetical protein
MQTHEGWGRQIVWGRKICVSFSRSSKSVWNGKSMSQMSYQWCKKSNGNIAQIFLRP